MQKFIVRGLSLELLRLYCSSFEVGGWHAEDGSTRQFGVKRFRTWLKLKQIGSLRHGSERERFHAQGN